MAEISRKHGMEMLEQGDQPHIAAMEDMKELMGDPKAMKEWFDTARKTFDGLTDD